MDAEDYKIAVKILDKHFPHNTYRARGDGEILHDDQCCPRCEWEEEIMNSMEEHYQSKIKTLKEEIRDLFSNSRTSEEVDRKLQKWLKENL